MVLTDQITSLAARIRDKFNEVTPLARRFEFGAALSDLESDLTTGVKMSIPGLGVAFTATRFRLTAHEAPSGSSLTVVVKRGSTTVATLTLAAGATSVEVVASEAFAATDSISAEVTAVGAVTTGKGPTLIISGTYS